MKFTKAEDQQKLGDYTDLIREIFKLRLEAIALRDKAEAKIEEANNLFTGLKGMTGLEALDTDLGVIREVTKSSSKFDKDVLKDYLIKQGVDSDTVAAAFKKATKKGKDTTSVSFYPPREEGSKS